MKLILRLIPICLICGIVVPTLALEEAMGTAWPVKEGFVVTCNHVVEDRPMVTLLNVAGHTLYGHVIFHDKVNDIALIKVESPQDLPPAIPLATSPMKMGASVFTIGYPQASLMGIYPKLALGNITALTGFRDDPRTYQISTALQSGNSGGPLLNLHGEAVSMTTSGLGLRFTALTGDLPQNVNYAIKVPYLNVLLNAVVGHDTIPELSSNEGTIEDLTERIKDSILLVIAEPVKRQPEETQVLGKPPESNLELARRGASFGLAGVAEIPDQELETLSKRFKVSKAAIRSLRWGPLIVSQVHPLSGGLWYELEYTSHSYTTKQIIHAAKTGEILERFYTQYSIDRTNSR